jgi:hypothetical protein
MAATAAVLRAATSRVSRAATCALEKPCDNWAGLREAACSVAQADLFGG